MRRRQPPPVLLVLPPLAEALVARALPRLQAGRPIPLLVLCRWQVPGSGSGPEALTRLPLVTLIASNPLGARLRHVKSVVVMCTPKHAGMSS